MSGATVGAGVLLILAGISFAIGAILPLVGEKGNISFYTLPLQKYLMVVSENPAIWRRANVFMAAAIVLLTAGMTVVTVLFEGAGERILSRLGWTGLIIAAVLWVVFSAFRAVTAVRAAGEFAASSTVPSYYEPLAEWGSALFYIYAVIGFLALTAYGASILLSDFLPAWSGWATILFSNAMLALLLITGATLPAFHYFPPLLIGILLLVNS